MEPKNLYKLILGWRILISDLDVKCMSVSHMEEYVACIICSYSNKKPALEEEKEPD